MKAKHILTAIALPALLAACSQDMELSDAINQKDFSNIPTVDVEFGATIGAETRMDTKFGWEVDDKIGLAWLGTGTLLANNGSGQAYQNNPLFCTDASNKAFNAATMLYVGKYFAYMPYAEGNMTVENIEFTTAGQPLTTNVNDLAKKAIFISPKKVTLATPNDEGKLKDDEEAAGMGKNIQLYLSRLSNAVTLDLTFKNTTALADLKIMGVSIDVQKKTVVKPDPDEATSTVSESTNVESFLPTSFKYNPQKDVNVKDWSSLDAAAVRTFFTANTDGTGNGSLSTALTDEEMGAISVTSKEGLALPAGGKLTTYALTLPAVEEIAEDPQPAKEGSGTTASVKTITYNLVVTVKTNYGDIVASNVKIQNEKKQDVENWKNAAIFTKFGQSGKIIAEVDAKKVSFPDTEVKTQEELNGVLAAAATAGYTKGIEITINPATPIANSGAFALDNFAMPADLKAPITLKAGGNAKGGLNFTGNSTIDKSLTIPAGTAVTVSGNLTVKNIVDSSNKQQVTLTVTEGITVAKGDGVLKNEGKIDADITTEALQENPAKDAGLYVSEGEKACLGTGKSITNNGAVQWKAGTVPAGTTGLVYAEVNSFSELRKAAQAATCVTTARFMKETEFSNSYTAVTIGQIEKIEVYAPVTINFYENDINEAQTITLSALKNLTIEENGKLIVKSDNKENTLIVSKKTESGKEVPDCNVTLEKNSELSFENLTITNFNILEYAGKVTLKNVEGDFENKTKTEGSDGSLSITK